MTYQGLNTDARAIALLLGDTVDPGAKPCPYPEELRDYDSGMTEVPPPLVKERLYSTCGNPRCVKPSHIILASEAKERLTKEPSSHFRNTKLTEEAVKEILKARWPNGIKGRPAVAVGVLAQEYGVSDATIREISAGRRWTHVFADVFAEDIAATRPPGFDLEEFEAHPAFIILYRQVQAEIDEEFGDTLIEYHREAMLLNRMVFLLKEADEEQAVAYQYACKRRGKPASIRDVRKANKEKESQSQSRTVADAPAPKEYDDGDYVIKIIGEEGDINV